MITRRPGLLARASALASIIMAATWWIGPGVATAKDAADAKPPTAAANAQAPAPTVDAKPTTDAKPPPTAATDIKAPAAAADAKPAAAAVDSKPPAPRADAKKSPPPVDPNSVLPLYTDGYAASYLPVPGFKRVDMPVREATEGGTDGCYIACAAHERKDSIYAPDANTFVVGAVRIIGNYQNGVCHPGGLEHIDLAADTRLSELCALAMPKLCDRHRCFAHGDTGNWVPPSQNVSASNFPIKAPNGEESCVLACYSHNNEGALYQVASDVFAVGGFQTGGRYVESICKPQNFQGDLANDPGFKRKCTELFPKACASDACWVNGETRGRLGGS